MDQSRKPRPRGRIHVLTFLFILIGLAVLFTAGGFTFAANQEQRDSFCASCHTQPESTFYQRSIDSNPVDLASFHTTKNTRCIDCHSGVGLTGRLQAELMGAQNALALVSGTAKQPALLTRPILDQNCLKCHAQVTTQREGRRNHFHFFLARWQANDPRAGTCVSCHVTHITDSNSEAFTVESNTRPVCDACHRALGEGGEGD